MEIVAHSLGTMLVARVDEARIDAASAIRFKERMRELSRMPGNPVVLDLSRVTFLDSSGLGAVVAVLKMLGPERRLELSGLTPNLMKVFRLTRMDSIFTLHETPPPFDIPATDVMRDAG